METFTTILDQLKNYHTTRDELELAKNHLQSNLTNLETVMPTKKAVIDFFSLVQKDFVSKAQIQAELGKITCESFFREVNSLYEAVSFVVLVHGTTTKKTANKVADILKNRFNNKTATQNMNYLNLHAYLKGNHIFTNQLKNPESITNVVMNVFQVGKETLSNVFKASLIKSIIGKLSFVQLRTFKQLGYSCKTTIFAESGILYMFMSVHGSVKTPDLMDFDVDETILKIEKLIRKIKKSKFRAKAKETIRKLTGRDKSLKKRTDRLWKEISTGRNLFDLHGFKSKKLENISKQELLHFYKSVFGSKRRKLSIQEFSRKTNISRHKHSFSGAKNNFVKVNSFREKGHFLNNKY